MVFIWGMGLCLCLILQKIITIKCRHLQLMLRCHNAHFSRISNFRRKTVLLWADHNNSKCHDWVFRKTFCDEKGIMHGFTKVANSAFYPSPLTFPSHFSPFNSHFLLSFFTLQLSHSPVTFHPTTLTFSSHFSPFNSHFLLSLFTLQLSLSPLTFHPLTLTFHLQLSLFTLQLSLFPLTFQPSTCTFYPSPQFPLSLFTLQLSLSPLTFHLQLSLFTLQLTFPSHFSPNSRFPS